MKEKLVRILICAKDTKLADRILWTVRETFPRDLYFQTIIKKTQFQPVWDIIEAGFADIIVIGTELSGGDAEDLIELAIKKNPKQPIIVYLQDEDEHVELNLRRKYRKNIDIVTQDELFEGLKTPLRDAYNDVLDYKSRHIVFSDLIFKVDEILFIKADGNYIEVTIYDFVKKTFRSINKKMSMKVFEGEYNTERDFVRCHASYIVNVRMIVGTVKVGNSLYLVLDIKDENGDPIEIPVSATYRKDVLKRLKGLI